MAAQARSASSASRTARARKPKARRKVYGCERPRIFTPPLRPLEPRSAATEKRTLGYAVVDFADKVLGIELYPWQKWLLVHALELLPDGTFRFRNVVVLVARQNGKSTLSQVLSLFFLYVLGTALVIGTAQDLDVAEEIWQGAVDIVEETPELDELKERVVKVNGKKSLELKSGERYKVKAANRRAGRGLSGDLILLDELREHQTWDAWGAITKTTMARANAQVWALSNAGDATSVVLRYLRKMAHEALGDPDGINAQDDPSRLLPDEDDLLDKDDLGLDVDEDFEVEDDTLGLFEWSAHPDRDVRDRDGWAEANPSLGYSITERTLASAAKTDPEWVFRTECLCQWSDGSLEGLFPPGSWEAQADEVSKVAKGERIIACVTVAHDRSRAHVSIAGLREDGKAHVGVVASRAGTEWVKGWLKSPEAPPFESVVVQERGAPESSLIEDLEREKIPLTMWGGSDLAKAHGSFYDAVTPGAEGPLRHRSQPVLEVAVATATTKPLGEAWVLDLRKSAGDGAPLKGVIGAYWGLASERTKPYVSAYAETDLVII